MAKVKYTGPAGQPCDELYEFNLEAENPKLALPGEVYEVPKEKVAPFVMNAHFSPEDAEARKVYDDLVAKGIIVAAPDSEGSEAVAEDPGVDATDGARELATELGIDLAEVEGSGENGRVQKPDVQKHADELAAALDSGPGEAVDPITGEGRGTSNNEGGEA